MSSSASYFTQNSIPNKIHFIWIGSPVPPEYLANIAHYAYLGRKDGFEVNLWTDKVSNYEKTNLLETEKLKLKIRTLTELQELMKNDFSSEQSRTLWQHINREMVGQVNYAASSDILRLLILAEEGGYYFDVDLEPNLHKLNASDPFDEFDGETIEDKEELFSSFETPPARYGFLCYCEEWGLTENEQHNLNPSQVARLGNHTLASTKNHQVIRACLNKVIEAYKYLDTIKSSQYTESGPKEFLLMDFKRSKTSVGLVGRRALTISSSGPSIIKDALESHTEEHHITNFNGLAFPLISLKNDRIGIKMTNAVVNYANTWLKPDKIKPRFFDC